MHTNIALHIAYSRMDGDEDSSREVNEEINIRV